MILYFCPGNAVLFANIITERLTISFLFFLNWIEFTRDQNLNQHRNDLWPKFKMIWKMIAKFQGVLDLGKIWMNEKKLNDKKIEMVYITKNVLEFHWHKKIYLIYFRMMWPKKCTFFRKNWQFVEICVFGVCQRLMAAWPVQLKQLMLNRSLLVLA